MTKEIKPTPSEAKSSERKLIPYYFPTVREAIDYYHPLLAQRDARIEALTEGLANALEIQIVKDAENLALRKENEDLKEELVAYQKESPKTATEINLQREILSLRSRLENAEKVIAQNNNVFGFISSHCESLPRAKQVAEMTLRGIDVTNPLREIAPQPAPIRKEGEGKEV